MKKLLWLISISMFSTQLEAQKIDITPFKVNERITDLPLINIINYEDSTTWLSEFGNKLLILNFWGINCSSCIRMLPFEDSLQRELKDKLQFIAVTYNQKKNVQEFLKKRELAGNNRLSFPIVTDDKLLSKLFAYDFIPHYVWITPNGKIIAITSNIMINEDAINNAIRFVREESERLKKANQPAAAFTLPKPQIDFHLLLDQIKY